MEDSSISNAVSTFVSDSLVDPFLRLLSLQLHHIIDVLLKEALLLHQTVHHLHFLLVRVGRQRLLGTLNWRQKACALRLLHFLLNRGFNGVFQLRGVVSLQHCCWRFASRQG